VANRAALLQGQPALAARAAEALRRTGWLSTCPPAFQDTLLGVAIIRRAAPGVQFVQSGDDTGGMFAICSGTAEVAFPSGHPDTRAIHLIHAGFWAGYKGLLGQPRHLTVCARTDVVWALVPRTAMHRHLAEHPGSWRHIAELIDQLVSIATSAMADATLQDSRDRAIAALLRLAGCRETDPPGNPEFEIRLSQSDIAAMATMSRNTFNRIVGELVEAGLVDLGYRSIRLLDPGALRAIISDRE
jgi:CRP/FNR family transcriptional regulator, cyclic AMP receptor protein